MQFSSRNGFHSQGYKKNKPFKHFKQQTKASMLLNTILDMYKKSSSLIGSFQSSDRLVNWFLPFHFISKVTINAKVNDWVGKSLLTFFWKKRFNPSAIAFKPFVWSMRRFFHRFVRKGYDAE